MRKDAMEAPARTATERMQALRRRIAEREARTRHSAEAESSPASMRTSPPADVAAVGAVSMRANVAQDAGADTPSSEAGNLHAKEYSVTAPSNEDVNMHQLGRRSGAAYVEDGGGRVPPCNADAVAAARFAAWHSGARG